MTTGEGERLARLEARMEQVQPTLTSDGAFKKDVAEKLAILIYQIDKFCVDLKETNAKVEAHGIRIAKNENDIASGIYNAKSEVKEMVVKVETKVDTAIAKFESSRKTLLWCLGGWGMTIVMMLGWIVKHG